MKQKLWENRAQRLNYRNREKNTSIFNALALDSIICYCWFSTLTVVIDKAIEEEKCRNDKLFPWLTRPDAFLNQLFISHSLLFSISHLSFFYYLTSNSESNDLLILYYYKNVMEFLSRDSLFCSFMINDTVDISNGVI